MSDAILICADRRTEKRYEYEMPLRFEGTDGQVHYSGAGRTVDLGRKSILFKTDHPPPQAAEIELRIEWPFLLQNVCALELRVWGKVLNSAARGTIVMMRRYEFRTYGARSFDQASVTEVQLDGHWDMVA
jgi:hypothetical protein